MNTYLPHLTIFRRERQTNKKGDKSKKMFTYDFDGTRIAVQNAKVEKFPPSAYLVK